MVESRVSCAGGSCIKVLTQTAECWLGTTRVGGSVVSKRSGSRHAAWALGIILAPVLLALAAGCGSSASPDPFLGTWQEQDAKTPVVIGKPASDYQVTMFIGTWGHAERNGDVLHCWAGAEPQVGKEILLTYQPDSGELLLTDPAAPGVHIQLHRVNESTAIPSPFPMPAASASASP